MQPPRRGSALLPPTPAAHAPRRREREKAARGEERAKEKEEREKQRAVEREERERQRAEAARAKEQARRYPMEDLELLAELRCQAAEAGACVEPAASRGSAPARRLCARVGGGLRAGGRMRAGEPAPTEDVAPPAWLSAEESQRLPTALYVADLVSQFAKQLGCRALNYEHLEQALAGGPGAGRQAAARRREALASAAGPPRATGLDPPAAGSAADATSGGAGDDEFGADALHAVYESLIELILEGVLEEEAATAQEKRWASLLRHAAMPAAAVLRRRCGRGRLGTHYGWPVLPMQLGHLARGAAAPCADALR